MGSTRFHRFDCCYHRVHFHRRIQVPPRQFGRKPEIWNIDYGLCYLQLVARCQWIVAVDQRSVSRRKIYSHGELNHQVFETGCDTDTWQAMFIMAANCAGIVGGQLFRSDDLPYYHRGWNIAVSFMSLSVALVVGLLILYVVANRRMKKSGNVVTSYNVYTDDKGRDPAVLEQASNDQTPKQQLYNF